MVYGVFVKITSAKADRARTVKWVIRSQIRFWILRKNTPNEWNRVKCPTL